MDIDYNLFRQRILPSDYITNLFYKKADEIFRIYQNNNENSDQNELTVTQLRNLNNYFYQAEGRYGKSRKERKENYKAFIKNYFNGSVDKKGLIARDRRETFWARNININGNKMAFGTYLLDELLNIETFISDSVCNNAKKCKFDLPSGNKKDKEELSNPKVFEKKFRKLCQNYDYEFRKYCVLYLVKALTNVFLVCDLKLAANNNIKNDLWRYISI